METSDRRHVRLEISERKRERKKITTGSGVEAILERKERNERTRKTKDERRKSQRWKLTRQITLRVLLELCNPLVEVLLLLLAVLQRSSLQLRVVSLYSRFTSASNVHNSKTSRFDKNELESESVVEFTIEEHNTRKKREDHLP